jgi:hypothetical protein
MCDPKKPPSGHEQSTEAEPKVVQNIAATFEGKGGAIVPAEGVNEGVVRPVFFPARRRKKQRDKAADGLLQMFPPDGKPPPDLSNAQLLAAYDAWRPKTEKGGEIEEVTAYNVSSDTILRAAGRRPR